jgi:hypothetical protein
MFVWFQAPAWCVDCVYTHAMYSTGCILHIYPTSHERQTHIPETIMPHTHTHGAWFCDGTHNLVTCKAGKLRKPVGLGGGGQGRIGAP